MRIWLDGPTRRVHDADATGSRLRAGPSTAGRIVPHRRLAHYRGQYAAAAGPRVPHVEDAVRRVSHVRSADDQRLLPRIQRASAGAVLRPLCGGGEEPSSGPATPTSVPAFFLDRIRRRCKRPVSHSPTSPQADPLIVSFRPSCCGMTACPNRSRTIARPIPAIA